MHEPDRCVKPARRVKSVRDPLWNTIRLDPVAVRIIDTPEFQRLRYIRQLGLVHLIYPGATHTRFDHALGVYHLTRRALSHLRETHRGGNEVWEGAELVPYAALLHDIGHYPLSHALEELPAELVPEGHEATGMHFLSSPELEAAVAELGEGSSTRIHDLVTGKSELPLAGLVSGGLDMDKMEYLRRDAFFCGVPYGEIDVARLLSGIALLADPVSGRFELGIREKGASAIESLLFAKYQMFRNVYWHHAVRGATCLYKRIVEEALAAGIVESAELVGPTDEVLLHELARRTEDDGRPIARKLAGRWLPALRNRRLPRRALELSVYDFEGVEPSWLSAPTERKRRFEDALAAELGLESGEVMIDFPRKPGMFQLDFLVERRSGAVERLDEAGMPGIVDLPKLGRELHTTASVLRIFTLDRRSLRAEDVARRIGFETPTD